MKISQLMIVLSLFIISSSIYASVNIFGWAAPGSWGGVGIAKEEDIAVLTHLVLYPIEPTSSQGNFHCSIPQWEIDSLKNMARRNSVKVLVSLGTGGNTLGQDIEADPTYIERFASYIVNFVEANDLDGVDNAWEAMFSGTESDRHKELLSMRRQFNNLSAAIHDSLDSRFGIDNKIFTVTVSGINNQWFSTQEYKDDSQIYAQGFWDNADYVMTMNYNDGVGAQHSTIGTAKTHTSQWLDFGLPKDKIVIGIPFFGYARWSDTTLVGGTVVKAACSYQKIIEDNPSLTIHDNVANYSFMSNADTYQIDYGYNGVSLVKEKMRWVDTSGMSGVLFWKLGNDLSITNPLSLIRAMKEYNSTPISDKKIITNSKTGLSYREISKNKLQIINPLNSPLELRITSISGKKITKLNIRSKEKEIILPKLANGTYVFTFKYQKNCYNTIHLIK